MIFNPPLELFTVAEYSWGDVEEAAVHPKPLLTPPQSAARPPLFLRLVHPHLSYFARGLTISDLLFRKDDVFGAVLKDLQKLPFLKPLLFQRLRHFYLAYRPPLFDDHSTSTSLYTRCTLAPNARSGTLLSPSSAARLLLTPPASVCSCVYNTSSRLRVYE